MKTSSKKHLRRTILCAIFAGIVAAPFAAQTAYALPIEGANAAANAGEANISTGGTVMDIVGKTEHNILKWEDFSIDSGEKVRFDNGTQTKDYLNLVTGEGASNIYGTIEGGRNVYLVNPHGILFAKDSQVNTGALYLSTAKPDDIAAATNTFKTNGTSPLSATAQTGDVLNLGTVKASKLYIEGKNVKVLNTDDIQNTDGTALTGTNVKIRSAETPHIGYDVANRATANFDEGGGSVPHSFYDYANPNTAKSASTRGWAVKNLGGTAHTDYDYMRVHDVYDLQNINAKRDGRYILAGDIDATATQDWNSGEGFAPLGNGGNAFTGRLDGAGHTLRGLYINRQDDFEIGLFGSVKGATIENLSLRDGNVKAEDYVGGIVGVAEEAVIRNVSYAGTVDGGRVVGGIVGGANGGSIQNAWNAGKVEGESSVGGIVGVADKGSTFQNVCNTGAISGVVTQSGGIAGYIENSRLQNAWNTGTVRGDQKVGGIVGEANGGTVSHAVWKSGSAVQAVGASSNGTDVTDVKVAPEADMKLAATYTDWKDAHGNALVATEGGKGTPWRIYDGKTTPMLTALMKGTKRLEKTYDGKTFGDGDAHILSDTPLEKNVGTRDASGIYSDAFGYDLIGSTYRIAPRVLTMSGVASQTKTYDGNTNADATQFSATLNNVVTGEESLVTATATGAAYNSKDVATASKVTYTGLALTGTGAANYTVATTAEGAGTISRRELTLGTVAAQTKTYDGTTAADAGKFSAGLNNTVAGDSVTATAAGATYNSKDVAGANTVNYTGVALGGADAGNYSLDAVAQGTGTITRRALTFDAVAAQTKTYDGNTNADAAQFSATLGNIVAGEENSVSATAAGATYNDKNVAGANKVSYTGVALTGTGAGNYSIADTAQGKGTITKRALTLGTVTAQTKIYDGTTAADAGKFSAALTNAIAGDSVAATATGAAYNSKNVAAASTIGYTGVALSGADAGNYSLAATTAQGAGTITARELTLGTVASQSKTYDGTRAADASKFSAALNNAVAGDNVTAAAAGATYNDHNVAAARTIDYTGVSLGGSDAGNYSLAATAAQGEGRITPKELNLALTGGARFDKTYDGTANVAQSLTKGTNYNLNGFVTGEGTDIELSAVTGKYADKNAARDKAVTFDGLTLTGTGAGNYTLNKTTLTGTGTITKRALTLGAVAAQTKTYDGTTAADASKFRAALNNVVAGDSVTAAAAGALYNDKNVARANRIDYTGVALSGVDAGNYSIANTAQGAGTITHRELTLTAAPHSIVQGEPLPSFKGHADGFADGEDERVFGADGLTFESAVTNTETPGSYAVIGKAGGVTDGVLGNYRIRQAADNATAFTIHAAALPGGLPASLVQDAAPRFDFGFGDTVYLYGTARPIRAATLGLYRFDAEDDLEIQGLRL
nr:YDG domain-containing protein [uncultured Selenomonas sp.]